MTYEICKHHQIHLRHRRATGGGNIPRAKRALRSNVARGVRVGRDGNGRRPLGGDYGIIASQRGNSYNTMKLTSKQIEYLVKQGELIHAECKDASGGLPDSMWDTISFSNPGIFRVNKAVAVEGGTSDARNSHIFNIFALVDIGERSGMGLADLYGHWKKYNLPEPAIMEEYDPDRVKITVYTDEECPKSAPKVPQTSPRVPQKCPKSAPKTLRDFPSSVRQVYKAMCDDISLTHRGLESKLGLAKTTIRKATATLIQNGFIRRVGSKKGGHWEVIGNG